MKLTAFKNRLRPSKQDDEISWIKGYNNALRDATQNLRGRKE